MCGRFTLAADFEEILNGFKLDKILYEHKPRYNIAPTQTIAGVKSEGSERLLDGFYWGLLPSWTKSKKMAYSTFNARSETIQSKPAFRAAFSTQRMVVLSDGFYEWQKIGKEKQPYRFALNSRKVFGFAGLYDHWTSPDGEVIQSCTIITTIPNRVTDKVHDRMPVILDDNAMEIWLDPKIRDKDVLQSLLIPYDPEDMYMYPVSKEVGNVRNQASTLIEKIPLNSI